MRLYSLRKFNRPLIVSHRSDDRFRYLRVVHPTFPFLAGTRAVVQADLAECPLLLREAFLEALYAAMEPSQAPPQGSDSRQANRLLTEWSCDPERSPAANRVYLQTLLLMIIEADNHGPASLKAQHGGPSKAELLGRAVGHAYSLSLPQALVEANHDAETDADSDDKVMLGAWWSLVMLDRWHAISTGNPLMIPNDTVVIPAALKSLFGVGYDMIRKFLPSFMTLILPRWSLIDVS